MLSKIAKHMLIVLYNNQGQPLSAKNIAEMLEISERSVSNYTKEVSDFCKKKILFGAVSPV